MKYILIAFFAMALFACNKKEVKTETPMVSIRYTAKISNTDTMISGYKIYDSLGTIDLVEYDEARRKKFIVFNRDSIPDGISTGSATVPDTFKGVPGLYVNKMLFVDGKPLIDAYNLVYDWVNLKMHVDTTLIQKLLDKNKLLTIENGLLRRDLKLFYEWKKTLEDAVEYPHKNSPQRR